MFHFTIIRQINYRLNLPCIATVSEKPGLHQTQEYQLPEWPIFYKQYTLGPTVW